MSDENKSQSQRQYEEFQESQRAIGKARRGEDPGSTIHGQKEYAEYKTREEQRKREQSQSGCFVATVAFGDPFCEEVLKLKRFRDYKLKNSIFGRAFISFYYKCGPYLAIIIGKSENMKRSCRVILQKICDKMD